MLGLDGGVAGKILKNPVIYAQGWGGHHILSDV